MPVGEDDVFGSDSPMDGEQGIILSIPPSPAAGPGEADVFGRSQSTQPADSPTKQIPSQSNDPRSQGESFGSRRRVGLRVKPPGEDDEGEEEHVPFHVKWSREGARRLARRTMDEIITRHHVQAWTDSSRRRPRDNAAYEVVVKHATLHKLFKKVAADSEPEVEEDIAKSKRRQQLNNTPVAKQQAHFLENSPFRVPHPDADSKQPRWNPYSGGDISKRHRTVDAGVCQPTPLISSRAAAVVEQQRLEAQAKLTQRNRSKSCGRDRSADDERVEPVWSHQIEDPEEAAVQVAAVLSTAPGTARETPLTLGLPPLSPGFRDGVREFEDGLSLDIPSILPGDSIILH